MLTKILIKDGVGSIERKGRHIKLVSAETQMQLEAMSPGGKVLLKTEIRSPMAVELDHDAVRLNFYGSDQLIEIWYSEMPLDYMQLVAIGATRIDAKVHKLVAGELKIAEPRGNRKSITVYPLTSDIYIGSQGQYGNGWLVRKGEQQNLEVIGELFAFKEATDVDWSTVPALTQVVSFALSQNTSTYAHFKGKSYFTDAASTTKVYRDDGTGGIKLTTYGALVNYLGRLWRLNGTSLAVSDDGESFNYVAGNSNFIAPDAGDISSRCRGVVTLYSKANAVIVADLVAKTIKQYKAKDFGQNGFRPYVACDAGLFAHFQNTGAGTGLFKLVDEATNTWVQVYESTNSTVQLNFVTADEETGFLIGVINGKLHQSVDGANWVKVSDTATGWGNYSTQYVYAGGHVFIDWGGNIKCFRKLPDYLGGAWEVKTATIFTGSTRDYRYTIDGNRLYGGSFQGAGTKVVEYAELPAIAAAETGVIKTLEVLF